MSVWIVFETHSVGEDNERGITGGWLPGRMSKRTRPRQQAGTDQGYADLSQRK